MTVNELIKQLSTFPLDAIVVYYESEWAAYYSFQKEFVLRPLKQITNDESPPVFIEPDRYSGSDFGVKTCIVVNAED